MYRRKEMNDGRECNVTAIACEPAIVGKSGDLEQYI